MLILLQNDMIDFIYTSIPRNNAFRIKCRNELICKYQVTSYHTHAHCTYNYNSKDVLPRLIFVVVLSLYFLICLNGKY